MARLILPPSYRESRDHHQHHVPHLDSGLDSKGGLDSKVSPLDERYHVQLLELMYAFCAWAREALPETEIEQGTAKGVSWMTVRGMGASDALEFACG